MEIMLQVWYIENPKSNISVGSIQIFLDEYLKENAGKIYDLATRNGINPELIVVRADIEGYSPVSQGFGTYYNYWGIGCYNNQPLSKCISYDTFDDGVLLLVKSTSK